MWEDNKVWRIDPVTGRAREIVKVGDTPMSVAVGAGSVWVTNHCDGTVSRIDPDTDTVVATIETGYHPQWLAVGNGFVWVGISGHAYFEACV
jgi:YVTN family beta-propeller protein